MLFVSRYLTYGFPKDIWNKYSSNILIGGALKTNRITYSLFVDTVLDQVETCIFLVCK